MHFYIFAKKKKKTLPVCRSKIKTQSFFTGQMGIPRAVSFFLIFLDQV